MTFARPLLPAVAALLVASSNANASEPSTDAPTRDVVWRKEWPRFSAWEGSATVVATFAGLMLERKKDDPTEANSIVEIPILDPGARFLLRGRSKNVQDAAGSYTDIGFRTMVLFNYVDAAASALLVHRNPDVAIQMGLIDLEVLTLAGLTQVATSRFFARPRPYVQDCSPSGTTITRTCGSNDDYVSFVSGHAMAAFTGAGLVCVHHQHLPLYGGGPIEAWACTWALTVATATGVFRIVSDSHYASDVLAGAGLGWFYGYIMPKLVHYRSPQRESNGPSTSAVRWMPSITPVGGGAALSLGGVF